LLGGTEMNREVEFRGLTTKGKWVYGSLVTTNSFIKQRPKQHTKTWIVESAFGNGGWFNILKRSYVKPETVGEFTGLKDKNGINIYEGDILWYDKDPDTYNKCEVVFTNLGFSAKHINRPDLPHWSMRGKIGDCGKSLFMEVIGNIHENKN